MSDYEIRNWFLNLSILTIFSAELIYGFFLTSEVSN